MPERARRARGSGRRRRTRPATCCCWPRSCAPEMKCSRRSSIELHLAAEQPRRPRDEHLLRPRVHDLHAETAADVRARCTRPWPAAAPSLAATAARTPVDVWVDDQTRSDCSSASQRATTPRPSSGIDSDCARRRGRARARAARPRSRRGASPTSWSRCAATLSGTSSCTSVRRRAARPRRRPPAAAARSRPGSGRRRPRRGSGRSATTMTTGSPTWWTTPLASGVPGAAVRQRRVRDEQGQRLGDRVPSRSSASEVLVGVDRRPARRRRAPSVTSMSTDPGVRVRAAHERRRQRAVAPRSSR